MQKKYYTSLLLSFCFLISFGKVFAACNTTADAGFDQYSIGKYSYECNVQNLCLGDRYGGDYWNFDTSKQLIIEHNMGKYPDLSKSNGLKGFADVRTIYQTTQNEIMNCAIIKSKYTIHKKIIDTYKISSRAKKYLEQANAALEKQMEKYKCIAPRDGDKIYNFKDLLDSMSYEQCGYSMYIWYYDQVVRKNPALGGKKLSTAVEWASYSASQSTEIANEFTLSERSVATALSMYKNFEKTYVAHVLLEIIEVELTEDKRFIGIMTKAIEQLVSVMKNAQKSPNMR